MKEGGGCVGGLVVGRVGKRRERKNEGGKRHRYGGLVLRERERVGEREKERKRERKWSRQVVYWWRRRTSSKEPWFSIALLARSSCTLCAPRPLRSEVRGPNLFWDECGGTGEMGVYVSSTCEVEGSNAKTCTRFIHLGTTILGIMV
jgi:hypothetical protein